MNRCGQCDNRTHLDFPSGIRVCQGCENPPAACVCRPVQAIPEWVRRAQQRRLAAKELVA